MNPTVQNWLYALGAIALIAVVYEFNKTAGLALAGLAGLAVISRM